MELGEYFNILKRDSLELYIYLQGGRLILKADHLGKTLSLYYYYYISWVTNSILLRQAPRNYVNCKVEDLNLNVNHLSLYYFYNIVLSCLTS